MKGIKIIILMFLLATVSNAFAQYTSIIVKGYYVTRFIKDEIDNQYQQKLNKINGRKYAMLIDLEQKNYFVPIEINGTQVNSNSALLSQITSENNMNKDTVYFMPNSRSIEKYVFYLTGRKIDVARSISILDDLKPSFPYYVHSGKNRYIYKCIYFEATGYISTIKNTSKDLFKLDIDLDAVNRNSANINAIFVTDIRNYNPSVNITGLTAWLPYSSK